MGGWAWKCGGGADAVEACDGDGETTDGGAVGVVGTTTATGMTAATTGKLLTIDTTSGVIVLVVAAVLAPVVPITYCGCCWWVML